MIKLEDLQPGLLIRGLLPDTMVTVVSVERHGTEAVTLVFREPNGRIGQQLLFRSDAARLELVNREHLLNFDGDGASFRLVAEAHRIRLAYLFDPVLAVHTSLIEPLPHQITAVYEIMLQRHPLRFLLADDPGAGKTIMTGLLIKELMARGDLHRCLIICPGNLVEQWQSELAQRFQLPFEILTNDRLETAHTGNWFREQDLVIARLDKLARDENAQQKLAAPDNRYDLVVVDEAHKLAATFHNNEIRYTKRYHLGQLVSRLTRHFLLLTATPHNGKEEDFQLFLALLDADRFEGRFRDGVHQVDVSDLMRRMVKEHLVTFDGRPLFPERIAHTTPYKLSPAEERLYQEVSNYVRKEFDRAEALSDPKRAGTVGFALTILQRRLASSPEAIYQSLRRRRERLVQRLHKTREQARRQSGSLNEEDRGGTLVLPMHPLLSADEIEDLEDAPDQEIAKTEEAILDQATAAITIADLEREIQTLQYLEQLAAEVRRSGQDAKWLQLAQLLHELFVSPTALISATTGESGNATRHAKLVIFTEHRDTLSYLRERISTLFGQPHVIAIIHGGMGREERQKEQERFLHDPEVRILIATDAAGEGINLQRAHLMVNYDLPWNPNRLEQRFGRIHRIGQTEVCHMWNMVAEGTREGDVYRRLLEKLDEARRALGGKVFDVLGKLHFTGRPLRELLIEAIRYGDQPEVRERLNQAIEHAVDQKHLQDLLEERALVHEVMDASRVARVREEMERAEARRLQPHYIESFFLEAFRRLGGRIYEREPRRYEIRYVPAIIRQRDRQHNRRGPVLERYERIAFEKNLLNVPNKPLAAFVCPGHPLLEAVIDLTLEQYRDLLKRGAVLVDERDPGVTPRLLFFIEHALQDASVLPSGERRVISRRMLYVEMAANGTTRHAQYAPYLDYRPLRADEPDVATILACPECSWIGHEVERRAQEYAIARIVPEHKNEVSERRRYWINKTRQAVSERLKKEIIFWDRRAEELREQERSGRPAATLNSNEARRRADELAERLKRRMAELDREEEISALPPVVIGSALIVPLGLLQRLRHAEVALALPTDTQEVAARARALVMAIERRLGYEPRDVEFERLGYDIESRDPRTGKLRFIEVKGRSASADFITVTRNEILTALNKPDDYFLAIVTFGEGEPQVFYVRQPFRREPDFGVTSVNYTVAELLARAEVPA